MTLVKIELSTTPTVGVSSLSFTLLGPFEASGETDYITFVDIDNDEITGCEPSGVGLPPFRGAELLVRVTVSGDEEIPDATPTIWECGDRELLEVHDDLVNASAHTLYAIVEGEPEIPLAGIVTVDFPTTLLRASEDVRLQSMTRRRGVGSDALPADRLGATFSMTPSALPECTLTPPLARRGEDVTVEASGLVPNGEVEIFFGRESVAVANSDDRGAVSVNVTVPEGTSKGLVGVFVRAVDRPVASTCGLIVERFQEQPP